MSKQRGTTLFPIGVLHILRTVIGRFHRKIPGRFCEVIALPPPLAPFEDLRRGQWEASGSLEPEATMFGESSRRTSRWQLVPRGCFAKAASASGGLEPPRIGIFSCQGAGKKRQGFHEPAPQTTLRVRCHVCGVALCSWRLPARIPCHMVIIEQLC